jgi:hypothetical protein
MGNSISNYFIDHVIHADSRYSIILWHMETICLANIYHIIYISKSEGGELNNV